MGMAWKTRSYSGGKGAHNGLNKEIRFTFGDAGNVQITFTKVGSRTKAKSRQSDIPTTD
ncbi:MAG: hypothetical protein ACI9FN_002702 [Saprospiraceae bacterium]|jgi:hypothetical protein